MVIRVLLLLLSVNLVNTFIITINNKINSKYHCNEVNNNINNNANDLTDLNINQLVNKRINHRRNKQFNEADKIKHYLNSNGIDIIDLPYNNNNETHQSIWKKQAPSLLLSNEYLSLSIMELADKLTEIIEDNDDSNENNKNDITNIITTVKELLKYQLYDKSNNISNYFDDKSNHLHGRKVADCAFKFAMAGIIDNELTSLLLKYAEKEISRFGHRSSCRSKDVIYFIERLVLAGYKYDSSSSLSSSSVFLIAFEILNKKIESEPYIVNSNTYQDLSSKKLSLFSSRVLLSLFKFSSKQDKRGFQVKEDSDSINKNDSDNYTKKTFNINDLYEDPTRPLVIDLGSGYGSSLLGLCYNDDSNNEHYNYLGCDMSKSACLYANAIAHRYDLSSRIHFLNTDIHRCLSSVASSYRGFVKVITINFPTPYRYELVNDYWKQFGISNDSNNNNKNNLDNDNDNDKDIDLDGNRELPRSFDDFMVSTKTLNIISKLNDNKYDNNDYDSNDKYNDNNNDDDNDNDNNNDNDNSKIYVYIQSNVEDVAVYMHHIFMNNGNFTVPNSNQIPAIFQIHDSDSKYNDDSLVITKRSILYHSTGFPKSGGEGWLRKSPFSRSFSETEMQYEYDNKKIYRFILATNK